MELYLDSSVFGGYFEAEFSVWSKKLIDDIIKAKHLAVISNLTLDELENAPINVRAKAEHVIRENARLVTLNNESRTLAEKYIVEKIVSSKYYADALHIATATIH